MIDKLTKEQEARFPEFIAKWTAIGLSTEPANRPVAEAAINDAYRVTGKVPPKRIVWCGSPLANGLTRAILKDKASVGDSVRASVGDSVGDSVRASVGDSVWASVRDSVRASVRASVWDSVGASVGASVGDSVGDSVGASVYGQHDANWIGFYDYFRTVVGLSAQTEKLKPLTVVTEHAGWWLPHENICWVSERHHRLYRNEVGRLHKDGAMACEYPDGFGVFALNGIRMKPEYVLTPAQKIKPGDVLKETNADQRRELIRKVGVDRMLSVLPNKLLHKRGDYEVISIDLGNGVLDARYLKMINPSVGCFHIEGIMPGLSTVEEALSWRNGGWHTDAEILT